MPDQRKSKLSTCDICVNPDPVNPLNDKSTMNKILEYMALAKPVIATNGGGNGEIVNDGITGFLIEPNQSETLCEKVEYLLKNKKKALEMGRSGKERVVKEFSLERMTNDFIELYEKSINGFA